MRFYATSVSVKPGLGTAGEKSLRDAKATVKRPGRLVGAFV
jgi:hypothetical protein